MAKSKHIVKLLLTTCLLGAIMLSGCTPAPEAPTPTKTQAPTKEVTEETAAVEVTEETAAPEEETETPTEETGDTGETKPVNALPETPIPQSFQASDGTTLEGIFYPSAYAEAPLVVLMHWALGDQSDWDAIAPWFQHQNYDPSGVESDMPWLDPTWFPPMLEGESFNVFTFTFRNCDGGCSDFNREGWLLDVEAAMLHAADLEGIDPGRVMAIGASIGADGAAYGCHFYNEQEGGGCVGAISLSPGGYLTMPYPEEVQNLETEIPTKPSWCFFSSNDGPSAQACQDASGALYETHEYVGDAHGMHLLDPEKAPNPMGLILTFAEQYLLMAE